MNRIRQLRLEKGLKQIELCKILGVSQAALSGYETGNYEPDNEILIKIANFFNTTTDYILGISEKKRLTPEEVSQMPEAQLLKETMENMTPEQRQQLVQYARFLVSEDKAGNLTKGEK